MRRVKDVQVDKTVYTVRELTVKEIINLFQRVEKKSPDSEDTDTTDSIGYLKSELQQMLALGLEGDYKVEDFYDMSPSELKQIYEAFKEVNSVFFGIARQVGMGELLEQVIRQIRIAFSEVLVSSLNRATPEYGSTGTPFLLKQ